MKSVTIASWIARRPILAAMSFAVTILLAFGAGIIYPIISLSSEELPRLSPGRPPTPVLSGARIAVPGGAWHSGPVSDGLLMVLVTLEVERHNDGRQICIGLRKSEADSKVPGKRLSIDMPDFLFEWISPHFPKLVPLSKCVVNFREMRGITRNKSFPDAHLIMLERPAAVFHGSNRAYYRVAAQTYIPGDIHSYGRNYLIAVHREEANLIDETRFRVY